MIAFATGTVLRKLNHRCLSKTFDVIKMLAVSQSAIELCGFLKCDFDP